eukprot:evm.model.scf_1250.3 EVM.evm.TU.scf_1250.3   scf_1250:10672-12413(-)
MHGAVKLALAQAARAPQLKTTKLACNGKGTMSRKVQAENQSDNLISANISPEEAASQGPTIVAEDSSWKCKCIVGADSETGPETQHELEVHKDDASQNEVTVGAPNSSGPADCSCRQDTELDDGSTAHKENVECKGSGTCGTEDPCESREGQMDGTRVEVEGNYDVENELDREGERVVDSSPLGGIAAPGTADCIPEAEGEESSAGGDDNKITPCREPVAALDVSIQDLEPQNDVMITVGEGRDQCSSPTGVTSHELGDADDIGATADGVRPTQHSDAALACAVVAADAMRGDRWCDWDLESDDVCSWGSSTEGIPVSRGSLVGDADRTHRSRVWVSAGSQLCCQKRE